MADGSPKTTLNPPLRPGFAALYQHHAPMVRRALRMLGVPPANLEDATQDVFVVLHRRLDDFDRERSLSNWLWGIARGVASGYRRSARRRARLHEALPLPEPTDPLDRGVARHEAAVILDDFLGSLDADKCAVFVLSELEGRRGPEIAEQLDVNVNTVYARLRAARKRFDAAMERHRAPRARPLFAWLPWAWPAWLGKPAVAVGVGALVTAVAVSRPMPEPPPSERAPAVVAAVADEAPPRMVPARRMARPSHHARAATPVPEEIEPEGIEPDEVLVLDEPAPRRRMRSSSPPAGEAGSPEPETTALEVSPEQVLAPPPRAPWGSTIDGHRPVHHPELVQPREHFIDELLRVAMRI